MIESFSKESWKHARLGDYFRIKHGFAFKGAYFSDKGKYIVLTPGNFRADGGIKLKGEREKYYTGPFPSEFLLKRRDFLVVMTDLTQNAPILGSPAFVNENDRFLHNQRLGKIVELNESEMHPSFLYYLFNSRDVREQIKASATGATVKHTAPERIYAINVAVPSLDTQRKIAAVLSTYDGLIENNTRRMKIIEEMARLIYDEWFVKFRFPGSEKRKMVESKLGPIPEGWELKKVTDAIAFNPKTSVSKEGEKPFIAMSGLSNDSMVIGEIEMRAGNGGSKFKNGDTLFARITPCLENGKTGYVQLLPSDAAVGFGSTEFIVMRSKTLTPEYVYLLARSDPFRDNAIKSMSGASGRQRVQEACFEKFLIAHPDPTTLDAFAEIASPMFKEVEIFGNKNANLRRTRDLLLPRLISGELDVENFDIAAPELAQDTENAAIVPTTV
jgi:type I restriction enzyme, S subunit